MATTVLSRNATLAAKAGQRGERAQQEGKEVGEEKEEDEREGPVISAGPCSRGGGGHAGGREGGGGGGAAAEGGGQELDSAPHMLFLLPANSLDWGSQAAAQGQVPVEGWLEVGCRLTSIRMVEDVRFGGTASA